MARTKRTHEGVNQEIIAALDILDEYKSMGVAFARHGPRASGKIQCFAAGRDDTNPSAYIDTNTGRYNDSATGESVSLWEFAATYGTFSDWQEARKHFAAKTGVKLGSGKSGNDWRTKLEFEDWTEQAIRFATVWCAKRNFSLGAARAAGARFAHWPCWIDKESGEKRRGSNKVIAFPCYGPQFTDADPVAWVVMNIIGGKLQLYKGKGAPATEHSKISVGPTSGTIMNPYAIMRLKDKPEAVEWVFKTAGPTDMLALMSRIPADQRDSHLVITNASGETGDVPSHVAGLLSGQRVAIIHDADQGGEVGAVKWLTALKDHARETRHVRLFQDVTANHGRDLRDFADEYDQTQANSGSNSHEHDDILQSLHGAGSPDAAILN